MVRRKVSTKIFLCLFAFLYSLTAFSDFTFATLKIPKGQEDKYEQNSIVFYNSDGKKNSNCFSPDRKCQLSDGSDIGVVADSFLSTEEFKKQMTASFSKLDTSESNFSTPTGRNFTDFIQAIKTKSSKKYLIVNYGNEINTALTEEQINQITLAAGSSTHLLFINNYSQDGHTDSSNRLIEQLSSKTQNVKLVDFSSKIKQNQNYISRAYITPEGAKDLVSMLSYLLNSGCSGSFTKYNFTDGQIRGIVAMAQQENGYSPPVSVITEISQMANLFESSHMKKYNQNANKEQGFIDMLLKSGWYASRTRGFYSETANIGSDIFEASKNALNSGRRILPTNVIEHDSMGDILTITNDGVQVDRRNRANYIPNKTVIRNSFGSIYVFYRWADSNVQDSKKGDPFGYLQDKGVGDFENEANEFLGSLGKSSNIQSGSSYRPSTSGGSNNSSVQISSTGPATDPDVVVTSDFKNYAGDTILNQTQLAQIAKNRPIYEKAAKEQGFPWQILAALHYREHMLDNSNPNNGQGIYQLYSYTNAGTNDNAFLPAGPVSDEEFLRQTKITAGIVKGKEPGLTENPDSKIVKRLFFKYNGVASIYKNQALDMGFTPEQADTGEGSPYVMSRADAKRDSTKGGMTWNMYTSDGHSTGGRNEVNFGAYVVYLALGGFTDNSGTNSCTETAGTNYSGGGNQQISQTALDLSWHHYEIESDPNTKNYYTSTMSSLIRKTGTAKYKEALIQAKNVGDNSDCGRFVSTVLRISGVDPNFPSVGTRHAILPYLLRNTALYDRITHDGDTSVLQSGDILIVPGHIKLVVEINGKLQEVQASLGGHAPETSDRLRLVDKRGENGKYYVFRKKV